ncbi:hypothetical protein AAG906_022959 [Vitis piasezkii]
MRYCRPLFRVILFYDFSSSDHLGNEADGGGEIRRNAADSSGAEDGLLRKTQTEEKKRDIRVRLYGSIFSYYLCSVYLFSLFLKWVLGLEAEILDIVHVDKEGAFPMLSTYRRRSLSEALYCHGEGVSVSLGSSCHFHASHHCISPWPWRSPLRPKELWWSRRASMPVTMLEEVRKTQHYKPCTFLR